MGLTRSEGISGYVGKRTVFVKKNKHRAGFKKRRKFVKKITRIIDSKDLMKNTYSIVKPFQAVATVNTGVGTQNFQVVGFKNSGADIVGIRNQINGITSMNADVSRYTIDAYMLQICMKNQEQTNAIVDLYEIVPRIATLQTVNATLVADVAQQAGASADYSVWGYTPFQCSPWCQQFKVLRKTRYLLAPGAVEIVDIRDTKKQTVEFSKYFGINDATPAGSMAVPKLSKYWMAITRGEPINDSTNTTNVNTSSFKVNFVVREDYHYSYKVSELSPQQFTTNTLGAIANNEEIILIDTGAKVAPPVQG